MKITEQQKQVFEEAVSKERLLSYKFSDSDNLELLYARYIFNVRVSEAFYPILSALEIALRNNLYSAISKIQGKNWLLNEVNTQNILSDNERKLLTDAYKKLYNKSLKELKKINKKKAPEEQEAEDILQTKAQNNVKSGGLIAELTFGFWVNLCKKSYKNSLWDREDFFANVFKDFDKYFTTTEWDKTKIIFPELKSILNLRNRIFHHEIIINNKTGLEYCYNTLEKVLYSLSEDYTKMFVNTFRFKDIIKQKP